MVVLRLKKAFPITFMSNPDFQRAVRRTLIRAGVEVAYSEGFSPHMQVDFTPPIPLGMDSTAEYVAVDTKMGREELLHVFNAHAPGGLTALAAFEVERFNPAALTAAACYEVSVNGDVAQKILAYVRAEEVVITYLDRGKTVSKEVGKKIFDATYAGGRLCLVLAAGNDNLRADRLLESAGAAIGVAFRPIDLVKTENLLTLDDRLIPFEKFLDGKYEKQNLH